MQHTAIAWSGRTARRPAADNPWDASRAAGHRFSGQDVDYPPRRSGAACRTRGPAPAGKSCL